MAGGAASARGGAMSKLPELRASARAAAAAPLATDRLALAMLMTGALVSDATRGAPGRRERRMRRAQLSIGVWVAERCIAGKRWVAPRTVELEAEDQSREERHVGGGTIWLAVRRTKLRRTVLAARSFAVYLSLPNVSTRQTLLPAVSDRVRPSGRTPATRRGRERLVHAPGQRRASHVGCGGGASGGAAAPRYSAPGEHAVEVRHHTRPRAAWAGMRVSEWGGACLCMVAGVTLQSRPRVLPGCPLVK
jgi:hypothetical protein